MKREEAIQTLNVMQSSYAHIRHSDAEWEAVEMAKEALKKEIPCGVWLHPICEGMSTCPACGFEFLDKMEADNFCSNCGQKIRRGQDG